ncbi:hypothetical protein IIA79_00075 [bacterium]|nr:hypothetical protein [bacterium]
MKALRIRFTLPAPRSVLIVYCICAIPVFLLLGLNNFSLARKDSAQIRGALAQHEEAGRQANLAEQGLRGAEAQQRRFRPYFSGPEALRASEKVQIARQDYEQKAAKLSEVGSMLANQRERRERRLLAIIPLVALTLLHGFGLLFFLPKRGQ